MFAADSLYAGGAVDMCDRRQQMLVVGPHARGEQHERTVGRAIRYAEVEVGRRGLHKHGRRERPKWFTMLDLGVQRVLHRRIGRIGEDAACAERAWSELHASMEPADYLVVRQQPRDRRCDGALVERGERYAFI